MKLIYYSLSLSGDSEDQGRLAQFLYSLTSLRRHNRELPVYLHLCGDLNPLFEHFLGQHFGLITIRFGSYAFMLDSVRPGASAWLADYPILHKFLSMRHLSDLGPDQVLYVDTDTYFHADPEQLFAACRQGRIYAREEPGTALSPLKVHDPDYFDDTAFAALAASLGARALRPFHTGVMLLNHAVWAHFTAESGRFLDYVLGLSRGLRPELDWPEGIASLSPPSTNAWIRDQIAFWLSLGHLDGFDWLRLNESQLLIGAEEAYYPQRYPRPVLSHYFTVHTGRFFAALAENPYLSAV